MNNVINYVNNGLSGPNVNKYVINLTVNCSPNPTSLDRLKALNLAEFEILLNVCASCAHDVLPMNLASAPTFSLFRCLSLSCSHGLSH